MSKYLGPIHYEMYEKIKFLDGLTEKVLAFVKEEGLEDVYFSVSSLGKLEEGELENIIDTSNIHAWLQKRVQLVENKFAAAVSLSLKAKPELEETMGQMLYECGTKENFDGTILEAYQWMTAHFLDGMPCDHVLLIEYQEENSIRFVVQKDVHEKYWKVFKTEQIYWKLREQYLQGVFSHAGYHITKMEESTYEMR